MQRIDLESDFSDPPEKNESIFSCFFCSLCCCCKCCKANHNQGIEEPFLSELKYSNLDTDDSDLPFPYGEDFPSNPRRAEITHPNIPVVKSVLDKHLEGDAEEARNPIDRLKNSLSKVSEFGSKRNFSSDSGDSFDNSDGRFSQLFSSMRGKSRSSSSDIAPYSFAESKDIMASANSSKREGSESTGTGVRSRSNSSDEAYSYSLKRALNVQRSRASAATPVRKSVKLMFPVYRSGFNFPYLCSNKSVCIPSPAHSRDSSLHCRTYATKHLIGDFISMLASLGVF